MDRAWVQRKVQPWPITPWLGDHGEPSSSLLSLYSLGWTFSVSISLCFFSSLCISRSPLPPLPSGGAFGILGDPLWPQHVPRDTSQVVAVLVPTPQMKTLRSCLQSIRHGQVPGRHSVHTSPSPRPSQSTTSRKPCHTPASGFHGMFCSLSSNPPSRPKALSQEPPVLTPFPPSHWQDCIFQRDRNREWPSLQLWEVRKLA